MVDARSPTQKFIDVHRLAEHYMTVIQGLEDNSLMRCIFAEGLAKQGQAPEVASAVLNPHAEPPQPTLADMRDVYAQDKGLADDRKAW